nr:copper chaperone PCu(A)C [Nocardia sp. CNY236]
MVACSSDSESEARSSADVVTISDEWAKAAETGMSAAFANLHNDSDTARTVVSASSPAADRVELHESVMENGTQIMRPKRDGFSIPAHGEKHLQPGGDHIMFMDLRAPLRTGAETSVTLTFDDGSTTTFTAQARDYSGNQENYVPDHGHGESQSGAQTPAHSG